MQIDKRYQQGLNGPLTLAVRDRIQKLREQGLTLDELGRVLGFSGTFVGRMIRQQHPANVRTIHIPTLVQKLEKQETIQVNSSSRVKVEDNKCSAESLTLEELVRAISAKGFDVSISPKS